jgi:hypothetical protein
VNEPRPPGRMLDARANPAPDESYAQAYCDGYAEGLREAFREMLANASRGHTAQELRMLVESRLARIPEDVEVKRRSVLGPPRKVTWGPLLRTPAPPPAATGPTPRRPVGSVPPGESCLFFERRPGLAVQCLASSHAGYALVLVISQHPPELKEVPRAKMEVIRPRSSKPEMGPSPQTADLGQIAARISSALETPAGVLIYIDALEFLLTENSVETTLKFVNWITNQVANSPNTVIACVDPDALGPEARGRFQRSFNILV